MTLIHLALLTSLLSVQSLAESTYQPPVPEQSPLVESTQNSAMEGELDELIAASPLLSFHRSIVEIESISANEHEVGEFIANYLEERNFTVEKQVVVTEGDGGKDSFNIFAYSAQNPEIILTSHIDTVPPFIPYSLSLPSGSSPVDNRDDILISGRGTVDAKGSVAAQVHAALSHLQDDPDTPLGLLFVVGEETGGGGMDYFSSSPLNTAPPSFRSVIFGEPTELALVSGHKGNLHFAINSKGVASHSGYPWLGESAISAILPALAKVDTLGNVPVSEGGLPSSEKYGRTTLNIGTFEGGVATNVVPESASAQVVARLAAGTPDEAKAIIQKAVSDATGGNENITIQYEGLGNPYPPINLDTDVDGFNVTTVNYGTDVPYWKIPSAEGETIKRYLYGPGSIFVSHADNEGLTVKDLETAVDGFKKLIAGSAQAKR